MDQPDHEKLITALRGAAQVMTDKRSMRDLEAMLTDLVHAAVQTVPHTRGGGISRTDEGAVHSSHATAEDIHRLDQIQSELGEGPCITAADDPPDAGIVVAHDLAGDDHHRWPNFAPRALDAGYRSMVSIHLSLSRDERSALNLYAAEPHVMSADAQLTAGMFGLQAAVLLHGAEHAAQLGHALETRDVIGQAKGILMERFVVDDEEAFQMLVRSSQDTNLKLVEVARWLSSEANRRRERNRQGDPRTTSGLPDSERD